MSDLEQNFYGWIRDYLPEQESEELSGLITHEAKKYGHAMMVLGMFIGAIGVTILIAWFS